ncbi:MAG: tetratricopeptide repeat protein [Saprospiraceae bacterium]
MKTFFFYLSLILVSCSVSAQDDPLTYFNRGVETVAVKEYKKALEFFDKALMLDPNLYYIYASRADVKTELGDFKGAMDDYNSYKKLVEDLNLLGDPDVLEKRLKLLALVSNGNPDAKADDSYLSNGSDLMNTNSDVKALYFRGKLKFESGDAQGALRDFNFALSQDSTFVAALVGRGYVYLKTRDLLSSLKDFNLALQYNPTEYHALVGRGEVKDKLRNYLSAIEDYNMAITLYPGKYNAFYDRGLAWFNQKRFDKAEEDFTTVIKLNGKHAKAYFSRAISRVNLRNKSEACVDLKMAQSLGHPQAGEYIGRFCN